VSDTLGKWLHYRFGKDDYTWAMLDGEERLYWEHEAAAVRRAVARGGFKDERDWNVATSERSSMRGWWQS